jgi:nuclear cap-binding protein subunit 1
MVSLGFKFAMIPANRMLDTPFSKEGQEILALLRKKSPEDAIQPVIDRIHAQALDISLPDPLVLSTDAYVTAICYIGSKSLSHVLSCIERCKDRLLTLGPQSPNARKQIIESVMEYWKDQPGIGVNIVDKLLNYTILSPASVVEWALGKQGKRLGEAFVYEMVSATIGKVTGRVRQVVRATKAPGLTSEQRKLLEGSAESERGSMRELFRLMEDLLVGWASGSKDQVLESGDGESEGEKMVRQWGERWLRVFRRKFAVEEAWGLEVGKQRVEDVVAVPEANGGNGVVEMVE